MDKPLAYALTLLALSVCAVRADAAQVNAGTDSAVTLNVPPPAQGFTVAILGDRTTGVPAGLAVLRQAVDELNLLKPDLVIHIGDLVPGYVRDMDRWRPRHRAGQVDPGRPEGPPLPHRRQPRRDHGHRQRGRPSRGGALQEELRPALLLLRLPRRPLHLPLHGRGARSPSPTSATPNCSGCATTSTARRRAASSSSCTSRSGNTRTPAGTPCSRCSRGARSAPSSPATSTTTTSPTCATASSITSSA